ncbi:hypothetical protein [Halobaculum gomorrense]|uniref:hypothetical protein n=1 Tax=Halobaculum gomorrense TaxID=43928 RepID=UPI000933FEA1|nr:hypothetical protein [Halobaculum gomorrense]
MHSRTRLCRRYRLGESADEAAGRRRDGAGTDEARERRDDAERADGVGDDEYPFIGDEWDIGASTTTVDWK